MATPISTRATPSSPSSRSAKEFKIKLDKLNDETVRSIEIDAENDNIERDHQHIYSTYSTSILGGVRSKSLQNLDALQSASEIDVFSSRRSSHDSMRQMRSQDEIVGDAPDALKLGCCSYISLVLPILHPFGPFRCCWDLLVMVLLVVTCIEVPITLAFNISMTLDNAAGRFALSIDILLLIDVLITFRTAYFNKWDKLKLVIDEWKIAKKYLTGWFAIDLLTSIPFEFLMMDAERGNVLKFVKVFRVFRFARIVKILRLFKMIRYFDGFMSQFVIRELLVVLKFAKILSLMLLFAHLSACTWFFVGYLTMESESGSWVSTIISEDKQFVDDLDVFTKYSYCWYWAVVTLFTTGYGDITATHGNTAEQWLVSLCILVGTCFFAYFIGTLTSLITEGDRIKSVELQKLEEAQAFCDMHKLPRELSRAILTHIRYHCGYNYVFDENDLFESLPPYLQKDIHSFLAQTVLLQIDFFKQFKSSLLGQIALKMRSVSCNENYCLFQKGERAHYIYVQRTGESTINYHDGWTRTMKRGDVIGENAVLSPKRKTTVVCDTFSEFYILGVQDIIAALTNEYPQTWPKRWSKMVKRLKEANKGRKHVVRNVDFDKHKFKKSSVEAAHVPAATAGKTVRSSLSILQSTISPVDRTQRSSGVVATVHLNSFGHVDSPSQHALEMAHMAPPPAPLHLQKSISAPGPPPRKTTDEDQDNSAIKRKTRRMFSGSFLRRRSSFERDHAIRKPSEKRHVKRELTNSELPKSDPRDVASFYVDRETDSSDDSADIVPKELRSDDTGDDTDERVVRSDTLNANAYFAIESHSALLPLHDNLLHSMDTALSPKRIVVDEPAMKSPHAHMMPTSGARRKHGAGVAVGARKGGKFGGKKRAVPVGKKMNKNINYAGTRPTTIPSSPITATAAAKGEGGSDNNDTALEEEEEEEKTTELDHSIMSAELKLPHKKTPNGDGVAHDTKTAPEEQRNVAVEIELVQQSQDEEDEDDGFEFTESYTQRNTVHSNDSEKKNTMETKL